MISDILSDAMRNIREYQRDFPDAYANLTDAINHVVGTMDALRLLLDAHPDYVLPMTQPFFPQPPQPGPAPPRRLPMNWQLLHNFKDKDGFHCVTIEGPDGDRSVRRVHELIADAWIPNPDNLPKVRHKDGNLDNNRADNLEWFGSAEDTDRLSL